jgi:Domain of unknown function (DUF6504)
MAHRYGDPIRVDSIWVDGERELRAFTWRGIRYPVAQMLGSWHLADRWWDERHSDRLYYRVQTSDFQVFEVYYDQVPGVWVLDVVLD